MTKDLEAIRHYIRSLVVRERALISVRVALQAGLLMLALVLLAILTAVFRWDRALVAGALVFIGGVGLWATVFAPLLLGWRRAADPMRQARRVEGIEPALQGRLLTSVERLDGPMGQESPEIVGLIARRALQRMASIPAGRVHRHYKLLLGGAGLAFALLFTLATSLFAPGGPMGAVDFWLSGEQAFADAVSESANAAIDHARVGDLVLEYTYPAYTGLDPTEVPNSTGEAHGPPGTLVRVRARTADPVDAASVFAYGQPGSNISVAEERIVSGEFTIQVEPGEWYLEMHRGESVKTSRAFAIKPEPDLAPEVVLSGDRRLEVPLDAPLGLEWQARDDYGLVRVVLHVDGKEVAELRQIQGRPEANGILSITPKQLGMSVGMRVKLQVGAWDNNAWSGSQLGLSEPPKELVVAAPEDQSQLADKERLELRDLLVDLLANQIVQEWPPGTSGAAVARSGETYSSFYDPVRQFLERTPGLRRDRFVARLMADVMGEGRTFIGYTQVNFEPDSRERATADVMMQATVLRDGSVQANEYAIVLLDRYVQSKALGEVLRATKSMASQGRRLERQLEQNADKNALLTVMDRLDASLKEVSEQLPYMNDNTTKRVVSQRSNEMRLLSEHVRKALNDPDRDDAKELAGRLSRQMMELQEDLEYRMRRMEDEENEMEQKLKDLLEELKRLEREQRQLQAKVQEMRTAADAEGAAEATRLWEQIERLADSAATKGEGVTDRLKKRNSPFFVQERVATAQRNSERVVDASRARDLRKALDDVNDALMGWSTNRRLIGDPSVSSIVSKLEQAERYLRQLARDSANTDPQVAAQARAMRQDQLKLQSALGEVQKAADEAIQEMPIEPRGMAEALDEADDAMRRAHRELEGGQPMPAEGAQGQAAEQIQEARERLEETMEQMAQSGEGAREGQPADSDGEDGMQESRDIDLDPSQVLSGGEIELEDQFNLDEFQEDLLNGMQGEVPDAYRAMKRRYYEELVTQ